MDTCFVSHLLDCVLILLVLSIFSFYEFETGHQNLIARGFEQVSIFFLLFVETGFVIITKVHRIIVNKQ